jgi:hypothetical protein
MDNRFLLDFVNMRKNLAKPVETNNKKPVKALNTLPEPEHEGITLAYIITEKPSRKEVIEYFRNRVEELVNEED